MTYFIALICLLLPSYLIRFSIFGIPTTLLEILIYCAVIITIVLKLKSQKSKIPALPVGRQSSKLSIPILLFVVSGVISVIISPDKKEALGLFKAYIFDPILFFLVIIYNIRDLKDVKLIIKAIILSGFLVALQAIWQKLTGQVTIDGRVVGIFGYSPNYLALYLVPIAALTSGYEFQLVNNDYFPKNYLAKKIWLYDLVFLTILLALWFSASRSAIIALIAGMGSFLILKYWNWLKSKKIALAVLAFLTILFIFIGWQAVKPNWLATAESGRASSSNNIRWEIWSTTVKDILPKNNIWLLGMGLGNYQNYFTELTKSRVNYPEWIAPMALTPHNLFLTIWVNLGLLGLVSFIWILILSFRQTKLNNLYSIILTSVMITIVTQGLVDSPYWKNDLAVIFWIIIALAVTYTERINEKIS